MGVTLFMHRGHTHHHTLAVAVVFEVCSSHLVWSSQRAQRITMDFSPLHTYTPPHCTPDNTGYTYSLRWGHCENEKNITGWNYRQWTSQMCFFCVCVAHLSLHSQ